jgi:hypothetical protein
MKIPAVLASLILAAVATAAPMRLAVTVSDSQGAEISANVIFDGQVVYEYGPNAAAGPIARFDLASPGWTDLTTGQAITLDQAKQWAQQSRQQTQTTLQRIPDANQRAFVGEMLEPNLAISRGGGTIRLRGQFISYAVSSPIVTSAEMLRLLFAYEELNAYRKAIVTRQAPPFLQLEVGRVAREEGMFPGRIVTDITTPAGTVTVTSVSVLTELTQSEEEAFRRQIAR